MGNPAEKLRPQLPENEGSLSVTLTVAQMRQLVEEGAARALDGHTPAEWTDQRGIAVFLQLSTKTVKKLCDDEGMPHVNVGDAKRFHLKTVNAWMLARAKKG